MITHDECIVDSQQPTCSKYTTAFVEDVNAEDDESQPPTIKISPDPPPDPDTPAPDHTNRTQDMINISIFADPTTEEAENVCHLCKKQFKNGTGKKKISVHAVKNTKLLNLNMKGTLTRTPL